MGRINDRAYQIGGNSPDLKVVGAHEHISNAAAHVSNDPLIKIVGFSLHRQRTGVCIDETVHRLHLRFWRQLGDVVLVRVRNPCVMRAHV